MRYSSSRSTVEVRVGRLADSPFVTIADQGPGVPAVDRAQLGRRFHRLAGGEMAGTGLGLSIVKRIAKLHGAVVSFDESATGGLAVSVTFPPDTAQLQQTMSRGRR